METETSKSPSGLAAEPFARSFIFDNPSIGRALRYTFAEKRLGRAVFMNGLLLVIALGVIQEVFTRGGLGLVSEQLSFGRAAFLVMALAESVVISLLVPISFAQLFNAERREDCFDQVVATGCSPLRVLLGRYAATLVFVAVVVGSALPFFVFSGIVLRGASLGEILTLYGVLAVYGAAIGAATLATTVIFDDDKFPIFLALIFSACAVVPAFSTDRRISPALAAWAPARHILVELGPAVRAAGLGDLGPPRLYGTEVPAAPFSCALYVGLLVLALAYTAVGPDLELSEGLDTFSSVTLNRGGEANRGRRGLAATLLRTVQLRFFYENLTPGVRGLGPLLRIATMVAIYTAGHALVLGMLWPKAQCAPKSWLDIKSSVLQPYIAFTGLTAGLVALASAGARAAVLPRGPGLSLGSFQLGRFPALFVVFGWALVLPPLLFFLVTGKWNLDPNADDAKQAMNLFYFVGFYACFMFALGLVAAMLTTNPYSAMGSTLAILTLTNLVPLLWVPLFTSSVVSQESSRFLDVSPIFAGLSIAEPGETVGFTTVKIDEKGDEQAVNYNHQPSWHPFAWVHVPITAILIVLGLVLERRDAKTRKFLSALAIAGALLALAPREASAQTASLTVELEVGIGGKAPGDGYVPILATVENATDHDVKATLVLKDASSQATFATFPNLSIVRGSGKQRWKQVVAAAAIAQSANNLVVEAVAEDGTVLVQNAVKAEIGRCEKVLIVLHKDGALPFALPSGGLRSVEVPTVKRGRTFKQGVDATWTVGCVPRADDLPRQPQGWSVASAVILGEFDFQPYPAEARALAGWVARGGDLIVVVGERAAVLRSSLGEVFGETFSAVASMPPATLDLERLGFSGKAPCAVLSPVATDRVETTATGEALIVRRRWGNGRVTFVAPDLWKPPILHAERGAALLSSLLAQRPSFCSRSDVMYSELSQLRVQPAKIGPAFGALIMYALLVGPILYFSLRPRKRGLLAWVLTPAIAIVASFLTPAYRVVLDQSESALVTASLIECAADDPVEVETSDAMLYSGGRERHDLVVRGEDVVANTMLPPRSWQQNCPRTGQPLGATGEGKKSLEFGLDVPLWGARYLTTEHVVRAKEPRISGKIVLRSTGFFLEGLQYRERGGLEDAWIVYPDFGSKSTQFHKLGTIATGATPTPEALTRAPNPTCCQKAQKELAEGILMKAIDRAAKKIDEPREAPIAYLIARLPDAPAFLTTNPIARSRASGAVIFATLPVEFAESMPLGTALVRREVVSENAGPDIDWTATTRIRLPKRSLPGAPAKITLDIAVAMPLAELELTWRDGTEWKKLDLAAVDAKKDGRDFRGTIVLDPRVLDERGEITFRQTQRTPATATAKDSIFADLDVTVDWGVPKTDK